MYHSTEGSNCTRIVSKQINSCCTITPPTECVAGVLFVIFSSVFFLRIPLDIDLNWMETFKYNCRFKRVGYKYICDPQHEKTYLLKCASKEDSDQPAHLRSLIRIFIVRMKKLCILVYPKCAHWRLWSDSDSADLSRRWALMPEGTLSDVVA